MNILIIDDETAERKLLERAICKCVPEVEIQSFGCVKDALEYTRTHSIDIAFVDIEMPEMNGMELATQLKESFPRLNIIFCTGYSEYALEAIQLHASGYIVKPARYEEVKSELEHLRYPIHSMRKTALPFIRTFGNFDVFVNDQPVHFQRKRAKEMLAYLVDRRGASVTRKELAAVLFEDAEYSRSAQAYISQIVKSLKDTLELYQIGDILVMDYNDYSVKVNAFTCDFYDYLEGKPEAKKAYRGEYMSQYSWSEYRRSAFAG